MCCSLPLSYGSCSRAGSTITFLTVNVEMEPMKKLLVVDDNEWILETMYDLLIPAKKTAAPHFEEMASSLFNNSSVNQLAAQQEDKREITGTTTNRRGGSGASRACVRIGGAVFGCVC